MKHFWRKKKN